MPRLKSLGKAGTTDGLAESSNLYYNRTREKKQSLRRDFFKALMGLQKRDILISIALEAYPATQIA